MIDIILFLFMRSMPRRSLPCHCRQRGYTKSALTLPFLMLYFRDESSALVTNLFPAYALIIVLRLPIFLHDTRSL